MVKFEPEGVKVLDPDDVPGLPIGSSGSKLYNDIVLCISDQYRSRSEVGERRIV